LTTLVFLDTEPNFSLTYQALKLDSAFFPIAMQFSRFLLDSTSSSLTCLISRKYRC
jgi:hypothetical protein